LLLNRNIFTNFILTIYNMLNRIILISITTLFSLHTYAQQFKNNVGAPYIGLSAYSTANNTIFGTQTNIASLGNLQQSSIGAFAERRYGLQDLHNLSLHTGFVTKSGNVGIQANRFGNEGFNETQLGLGYGINLNNKISVGARVNYYNQLIAGYGNASTVNAEAGILLQLTAKLKSGVSVFNPVASAFGINKTEKLASIYKLGLGYDVSKKVLIATEFVKQENEPINLIAMVHYQFEKKFYAKVGASSAAANFFAAAGLSLNNQFRIELFASHHQQLGFSPGLMLLFTPNAKVTQ
jgi:hypothetical protein